jgi:hypothetical protein
VADEAQGARLGEAQGAFDRGDFAAARRLARSLVASDDAATREAARVLLQRTAVDPLIVGLTVVCALFFVVAIALTLHIF